MAFRYGQNHQTVHIYNEIQHIDIEPYIYTLKLKIYISNRIHTNRNYTYEHRTACMYIEPRTYTLKLHIYTSNQIQICRNYTYINGTVQINRNAFVHIEIMRFYFELFACARRAILYEVLNRENFYINRNFGQPVSGY